MKRLLFTSICLTTVAAPFSLPALEPEQGRLRHVIRTVTPVKEDNKSDRRIDAVEEKGQLLQGNFIVTVAENKNHLFRNCSSVRIIPEGKLYRDASGAIAFSGKISFKQKDNLKKLVGKIVLLPEYLP